MAGWISTLEETVSVFLFSFLKFVKTISSRLFDYTTQTNLSLILISHMPYHPFPSYMTVHTDLALNSTLTTLDLTCCACNDAAVAPLGDLLGSPSASLRVLRLGGNAIGWKGAQALARGLAENTSLQNLVLDDNRLGHAGVLALLEAVKVGDLVSNNSWVVIFFQTMKGVPPKHPELERW